MEEKKKTNAKKKTVLPALLNFFYFPLALFPFLCLLPDETIQGQVIFQLLFCSGVITILQAIVGIKLPVMMSPSSIFISEVILILKSSYWEMYSTGDLYAMGPDIRFKEYTIRTQELRGVLILCAIISLIICGILWYLPIKLCSATISATLISLSLLHVKYMFVENGTSLLSILAFFLPLVCYMIENLLSFSNKSNNEDSVVTLDVFQQFSVLFPFVILVAININSEQENHNTLLERAIGSHSWYSLNLLLKVSDFTSPSLATKSIILLPSFCSQFITSYCCYQTLSRDKERHLKALLLEVAFLLTSAGIGVPIPLTIDPSSIGIIQLTKMKDTESSLIAGGLLILFSVMVRMVNLFSYVSYHISSGLNAFIYAQMFTKGLQEMKTDENYCTSIVAISVISGMVLSSASLEIESNNVYSIAGFIFKCPVTVTFFTSIMLSLAFRSSILHDD